MAGMSQTARVRAGIARTFQSSEAGARLDRHGEHPPGSPPSLQAGSLDRAVVVAPASDARKPKLAPIVHGNARTLRSRPMTPIAIRATCRWVPRRSSRSAGPWWPSPVVSCCWMNRAAGPGSRRRDGLAPPDFCELVEERDLCLVIIEHDLDLVTALCPEISVLHFGRIISRKDSPAEVTSDPVVIEAYLGAGFELSEHAAA